MLIRLNVDKVRVVGGCGAVMGRPSWGRADGGQHSLLMAGTQSNFQILTYF